MGRMKKIDEGRGIVIPLLITRIDKQKPKKYMKHKREKQGKTGEI